MIPFPDKKYSIIYADPPWSYSDSGCSGAAAAQYATMSINELKQLPVNPAGGGIAADDCVLFMWATYPKMQEALDLIEAWGFKYKSIAFQWIKQNRSGNGYFFGLGRWTRGNTEPCLIAIKGKPKRISAGVGQLVFSPLRRHSICKLIRTELEKVDTTIMVQVKSNDTVEVMTTYLSDFSRNTLYRAKADAPGLRTGFRGREVALIELRSLCIPNEGTAYLLDLLSRMTNENSVSTNDNGVTQTVEARQGVALNAVVEIKPRVMLRPFRTFLEVEQPESEFLLRVDPDEGIGFFEADGGIWKLEAKKNIADYFLKNMGDLIDAGKVVVMQ